MGKVDFQVMGHNISLIDHQDRICFHVLKDKSFEPNSLSNWASICAGGGEVLDIGAYTGLYTILACKAGAKPTAIEPMPFNLHRIEQNLCINKIKPSDIMLIPGVASDKQGKMMIGYSPSVVGLTSGASIFRKTGEHIVVNSIRVDDIPFDNLRAIKIDVERAEPLVLRGARKTLEQHRPTLIIEVLGDAEGAAVANELPDFYREPVVVDVRNWLLSPK